MNYPQLHAPVVSLTILLVSFLTGCSSGEGEVISADAAIQSSSQPNDLYGFPSDSLIAITGVIQRNDFLSTILGGHGVPYAIIDRVAAMSRDVFDVRKFRAGSNYSILCTTDSVPRCFIYEINSIEFVVYEFSTDSVKVYRSSKEVKLLERQGSGVISGSLWQNMKDAGLDPVLALSLSDIFAWTIDFYRLQEGDAFRLIYDDRYVDGKPAGPGDIKAAWMRHNGEEYYAFRFEQDSVADYFSDSAMSLRKQFLIAPVQYSRIASRYTRSRFHPILKYHRPHLGTDYSAPHGTPIWATGDGTIIEAQYKGGNGNYVKIRHNSTYETQYLHMSKFAKGIRSGTRVKQGDIIGYVGSTGLSTGPHVCYRFWKNGKQVDHLREKFPPAEPVKRENMDAFTSLRDSLRDRLDAMLIVMP